MKEKSTTISISINNKLLTKLDNLSKKQKQKRSQTINSILENVLYDNIYYLEICKRKAELDIIKYSKLLEELKK